MQNMTSSVFLVSIHIPLAAPMRDLELAVLPHPLPIPNTAKHAHVSRWLFSIFTTDVPELGYAAVN